MTLAVSLKRRVTGGQGARAAALDARARRKRRSRGAHARLHGAGTPGKPRPRAARNGPRAQGAGSSGKLNRRRASQESSKRRAMSPKAQAHSQELFEGHLLALLLLNFPYGREERIKDIMPCPVLEQL